MVIIWENIIVMTLIAVVLVFVIGIIGVIVIKNIIESFRR